MVTYADLATMDQEQLRSAFAAPSEEIARLVRIPAEGSNAEARLQLSQRLLDGLGIDRSPKEAIRRFHEAAINESRRPC